MSRNAGGTVDEARVIPLHGELAERLQRAGRLAGRRAGRALPGGRASVHPLAPPVETPAEVVAPRPGRPAWEHRVAAAASFVRRRLEGNYEVDEFGFDRDLTQHVVLPAFEPLYRSWFRVDVSGVENIPSAGGGLLVANHAGGLWPIDVAMTAVAVHTEHPGGRFLRVLGDDLLFRLPGTGAATRKVGGAVARSEDADRLLASGELVGTWPEGMDGLGKPFARRYRLQRFDDSAFVGSALRAGVPIIPVSIIGAEEAHPVLGNARTLARVLGLPQFPLTPTFPWLGPLGLVPLPSKWHIDFGAAIDTAGLAPDAADDPGELFDLADRVRETVQANVYRLLAQRRSVWR